MSYKIEVNRVGGVNVVHIAPGVETLRLSLTADEARQLCDDLSVAVCKADEIRSDLRAKRRDEIKRQIHNLQDELNELSSQDGFPRVEINLTGSMGEHHDVLMIQPIYAPDWNGAR